MKKAFTLAEVMIVLTVIGVLTAILMPIAFHSTPDQNVMRFKKATTTLGTIVREMVSSDQYFQDGNLAKTAAGANSTSRNVCDAMIDILNYKTANCGNTNGAGDNSSSPDSSCANATKVQATTPDGVQWFLSSDTAYANMSSYKVFCFDVDGIGYNEPPFGFAVRGDGKMIYGTRAQQWSEKSIQRGG